MTLKNPRINITFETEIVKTFMLIAQHNQQTLSSVVRDLALEALELREDFFLSALAKKLDKKDTKLYNHKKAWQ